MASQRFGLPPIAAEQLGPSYERCPECSAASTTRHYGSCEWAACTYSGGQYLQCGPDMHADGWRTRRCIPTVFDGWPTGELDAARADLWFRRWSYPATGETGRSTCTVHAPDAQPDTFRLATTCTWSPEQERWISRT